MQLKKARVLRFQTVKCVKYFARGMTTRIGLTSPNYDSSQESKEMGHDYSYRDIQLFRNYGTRERLTITVTVR